jgi:hypothetical protein
MPEATIAKSVSRYNKAIGDDAAAAAISRANAAARAADEAEGVKPRIEMIHHALYDDSPAALKQDDIFIQQRGGAAKNIQGQRNLEAVDNVLAHEVGAPDSSGAYTAVVDAGRDAAREAVSKELTLLGHGAINGGGKKFVQAIKANPELKILNDKIAGIQNEIGRMSIPDARAKLRVDRFKGYLDAESIRGGIISPESADILRAMNVISGGKLKGVGGQLLADNVTREATQEGLTKLAQSVDGHIAGIAKARSALEVTMNKASNRYPDKSLIARTLEAEITTMESMALMLTLNSRTCLESWRELSHWEEQLLRQRL